MSCLAGMAREKLGNHSSYPHEIFDCGQEGVQEGSQVSDIVQRVNGSDNLWEEIEMKQMSGGEGKGGEKYV